MKKGMSSYNLIEKPSSNMRRKLSKAKSAMSNVVPQSRVKNTNDDALSASGALND